MSVFWVSDPGVTRRCGAALATLALCLALPLGALSARDATAASAATRDSVRTARRVVIDESGVRIHTLSGDSVIESSGNTERENDVTIVPRRNGHRVHISEHAITIDDKDSDHDASGVNVDTDGSDMVRVFADAEVPRGEHVDGDVVAVFGSVTVHGDVAGSVVAVFGSVKLDTSATVHGDAVAIGGALDAPTGSVVEGNSVSLGLLPLAWGLPALPVVLGMILAGWLSMLFLAWLLHLLFADRMERAAQTASRRTGLSLLMGFISAPLMVLACVLLLVTVLGIPFAFLLPIAYAVLTLAGQLAATYVLGSKLMRRRLGDPWAFTPIVTGTLFIAAFFVIGAFFASGTGFVRTAALFFDLLGALLLAGLTVIGTGAFLVSRFGSRPSASASGALGAPGAVVVPAGPVS
jgi:hypothetical protein